MTREVTLATVQTKNVVVVGLEEENLAILRDLPDPSYRFHGLLDPKSLLGVDHLDLPALVEDAEKWLDEFGEPVHAIVGYWDFPVTSLVPILCGPRGLPSAPLEAVAKCEHKYWSRLEQQRVIDDIPAFGLIDLDSPDGGRLPQGMDFPVWVKPVKSVASVLAFYAGDQAELDRAVAELREGVERMGEPFQAVLDMLDLPAEIAEVGGSAALVEEAVTGWQVTVEGHEYAGEIRVHGIVDSLSYPGTTSFLRYQYPSGLPERVQELLADRSRKVIAQVGLTSSAFNIEYFWNPAEDRIALLEVNPRHSQSHAWMFEQVDGRPNHQVMVRLGLGEDPALPYRQGPYRLAAKCFVRSFRDGVVTRAPSPEQVARIESELGVHVQLVATEGVRLRDLHEQDSYSYELARVFVAADDETRLVDTFDRCVEMLGYEVSDG